MLLDFVHRHLDEVFVHFGAHGAFQRVRIGRAQHAERARRCHDDHGLGLAGGKRGIEMLDELGKEGLFRLRMPVGLLVGAAAVADRAMGTAGRVSAELARWQVLLLEHLERLEVGKFGVAGVFQDERLGAVAHHHPFAVADQ